MIACCTSCAACLQDRALTSLDAVLFDFISPKRLQSLDHAQQRVTRLDIERCCVGLVSDLADVDGLGRIEERGYTDFISDLVRLYELVSVSHGANDFRCMAHPCYIAPSSGDRNLYRRFVSNLEPNNGVAKPPPTA